MPGPDVYINTFVLATHGVTVPVLLASFAVPRKIGPVSDPQDMSLAVGYTPMCEAHQYLLPGKKTEAKISTVHSWFLNMDS